ncbi:MAG: hypothetical protein JW839_11500 [Candidatus Lokiarchaeota archaeon]|nr:hypothetical protein [Candidatus Lokiarchaeota archaeon]
MATEARSRDEGRSIIRIPSKVMDELGIKTGDAAEIRAEKSTCAITWPAYPHDADSMLARIDNTIRVNAGAEYGKEVRVSRAMVAKAECITLVPFNTKLRTDERFESFIRRKLLNLPVTVGDVLRVPIGISREIDFVVKDAAPSGHVIVRAGTIVVVETSGDDARAVIPLPREFTEEIKQQLKQLFTIARRVNITDIASIMRVPRSIAIKRILEWSNLIEIKIDGDFIVIDDANAAKLADMLEQWYDE